LDLQQDELAISSILGIEDDEEWPGHRVKLVRERVPTPEGGSTIGIRVRSAAAPVKQAPARNSENPADEADPAAWPDDNDVFDAA
jgi:hypothetical protein